MISKIGTQCKKSKKKTRFCNHTKKCDAEIRTATSIE